MTPRFKAIYIDGTEPKAEKKKISEEEKAFKDVVSQVMSCSSEELNEISEQYGLDLILGVYPKVEDKRKAIVEAIKVQMAEEKKSKKAKKEPEVKAETSESATNVVDSEPEKKKAKDK